MRLADAEHTTRPWRIHELTKDFRLEDVWELRAPGGPDQFKRLVQGFTSFDPGADSSSAIVRALFALRWKLGELLGWDDAREGTGQRVESLTERLPDDLRARPGPTIRGTPFKSLYQLDNELAAEIANETMHGVMHLGWVPEENRAQMAVLVKPNGPFGQLYMLAIKPFRYLSVYPVLLRDVERAWADSR
ncbi:MAG: DUF2867 domain-containing protein [Solirubrobacterales bacterium]|nr:DUF2867 domain-containing protein [Solirubrobacterales bacterium]